MKIIVAPILILLATAELAGAQTHPPPIQPTNPPITSPAATPPAAVVPAVPPANLHRLTRDLKTASDNVRSQGEFGAQLWLVADAGFFQDWRKPETPALDPKDATLRGQPLFTVVVFYGPTRDAKGQADVTYDLVVKRPDGSTYHEAKGLPGLQAAAPADGRMLLLGRSYLNITPDPGDPAGKYVVEATVYDNLAKTSLALKQGFTVREEASPTP